MTWSWENLKTAVQHEFTKWPYLLWRRFEMRREGTPAEWGFTVCGFHWLWMTRIRLIRKSPGDAERIFADGSGGPRYSGPICDECSVRMLAGMRRDLAGKGWVATPEGVRRAES